MFITLGESVQEIMLERIRRAKSLGIFADEAADVAVLEQLINFIKYINREIGEADRILGNQVYRCLPRCKCGGHHWSNLGCLKNAT